MFKLRGNRIKELKETVLEVVYILGEQQYTLEVMMLNLESHRKAEEKMLKLIKEMAEVAFKKDSKKEEEKNE